MPPRPDVSDARRAQILGAAVAVFARAGLQEARMDDIAREAGLSKGALYLYFDSKDDIIACLMRDLFTRQFEDAKAVLAAPGTVADRLLALTHRVAQDIGEMEAVMPIAWELYAVAARRRDIREFLRGYFDDYRDLLTAFFRRRVRAGELRAVKPDALAVSVIALYEGLTILWVTSPRAVRWEEQTAAAVRLLLTGLGGTRRSSARKEET